MATTLAEEYQEIETKPPDDPVKRICFLGVYTTLRRKKLQQVWERMPEESREEILQNSLEVVKENLRKLQTG